MEIVLVKGYHRFIEGRKKIGGNDNEFRKQFISGTKKMRSFTGSCGRKIGSEQTNRFKMGNRRNGSGYSSVEKMAVLYHVSLDELIDFDIDLKEIQEAIDRTTEKVEEKINWTNVWGKNTPSFSNTRRM